MMDKYDAGVFGAVLGGLAGGILGVVVGSIITDKDDTARYFPAENGRPALMRTYESSSRDDVYVETDGEFRRLEGYLAEIEDKNERKIEEYSIKKRVGW